MEAILLALSIYFLIWFVGLTLIKNAGLIDIAWGLGFVLTVWVAQMVYQNTIGWVFVGLISLWGLRLAYHIGRRNIGKPEDFRYHNFRKAWGKTYNFRAFFQIYLLQAGLNFVVSLAFIEGMQRNHIHNMWVYGLGMVLYGVGFAFEVIGDAQLYAHTSNPRNKGVLLTSGLWGKTSHPNYFGEAVLWTGIAMMSIGLNTSFMPLVGAVTITILVRYVSGVPMLEARMAKYVGFEHYAKTVPIFFPKLK